MDRREDGSFAEGWPIGYSDYEFPQHKSCEDRFNMLRKAQESMQCIAEADIRCIDAWTNDINSFFRAWPDQLYAIDGNRVVFVGSPSTSRPGLRDEYFSEQLERFLQSRDGTS